ncbi:MAG TPA: imidazole glycerol phosphate synthase subunit HisH [Acidimicrobiales bacterium]|nr:imidazole glycerol phosphate synthase subunit HisH [Acidimicrobiales bacterium]
MIAVLDYGIGNLRSAEKALLHLGADARLVSDPAGAAGATGVVLPGVGAFGACAEALRACKLDTVVLEAVEAGIPVLGLCVGFQLLFEGSEESPGVPGLGLIGGRLRRLPPSVKRPQMQWNRTPTIPGRRSLLLAPFALPGDGAAEQAQGGPAPWFYYVHSFAMFMEHAAGADAADAADAAVATCQYGAEVIAAVERGRLYGTQFHPEKSGRSGLRLLAAFLDICAETPAR